MILLIISYSERDRERGKIHFMYQSIASDLFSTHSATHMHIMNILMQQPRFIQWHIFNLSHKKIELHKENWWVCHGFCIKDGCYD